MEVSYPHRLLADLLHQFDKENCDPVLPKQVSMSAGSSSSGSGVPKAMQQFSGLSGCTYKFYQS